MPRPRPEAVDAPARRLLSRSPLDRPPSLRHRPSRTGAPWVRHRTMMPTQTRRRRHAEGGTLPRPSTPHLSTRGGVLAPASGECVEPSPVSWRSFILLRRRLPPEPDDPPSGRDHPPGPVRRWRGTIVIPGLRGRSAGEVAPVTLGEPPSRPALEPVAKTSGLRARVGSGRAHPGHRTRPGVQHRPMPAPDGFTVPSDADQGSPDGPHTDGLPRP